MINFTWNPPVQPSISWPLIAAILGPLGVAVGAYLAHKLSRDRDVRAHRRQKIEEALLAGRGHISDLLVEAHTFNNVAKGLYTLTHAKDKLLDRAKDSFHQQTQAIHRFEMLRELYFPDLREINEKLIVVRTKMLHFVDALQRVERAEPHAEPSISGVLSDVISEYHNVEDALGAILRKEIATIDGSATKQPAPVR